MPNIKEINKSLYADVEQILEAHGFEFGDMGRWYLPEGFEFSQSVCLLVCFPSCPVTAAVEIYICANESQDEHDSTLREVLYETDPAEYRKTIVNYLVAMTISLARLKRAKERISSENA